MSGFVGRAPQRPNHSLGNSITVPGEPPSGLAIGSKRKVVRTTMACSDVGTKILQEMWEGTFWKASGLAWTRGTVCVHPSERPGEVWAAWRALFLPYQEGAGGGYKRRVLCLCGSAQGVCAADEAGSSGGQSPVYETCGGKAVLKALNGAGQARPPLAVRCMSTTSAGPLKSSAGLVKRGGCALSRGLGAWASSFELPHDHESSLPRNDGCMLGELRVAGFSLVNCHWKQAFLSPWTGCDSKGEGCDERILATS